MTLLVEAGTAAPRVLLVEPSAENRRAIVRHLDRRGWAVSCVATSESAVWALRNQHFDAVLCTWRHLDAASVMAEADHRRVRASIFSGAPAVEPFLDRWILKPDLDALDAFLAETSAARVS